MVVDLDKLYNWPFEEIEQTYTVRDSIIYALGLGFSTNPTDDEQLNFTFEERNFKTVPTMAAVLCSPGFWLRNPDLGIAWEKVLHGEQSIELHRALPTHATVKARTRISDIIDKGEGKGALIFTERTLINVASDEALATLKSTTFARGDGGFGKTPGVQPAPHTLPNRLPDRICDLPTSPQAALVYRLSGDLNPLHAEPRVAAQVGFERPILHGLCTLGVSGHAVLKTYCGYETGRFKSLKLRFSAPVFPGEIIRTEMWRDGDQISFRARVIERDIIVLDNGLSIVDVG
ncbi:MAG: 3-alpha,7-alpha,12-alpha-trihydroxy-5-beta-cholest-24-enoyl-CoA hydratase [Magnetovibrio sp.]|nr:3-alpha,7-alpha,12-alpha-trihydroxy-5-beta-cholest-24-enoyl-CoA hydratase [Magnetovibrio sp.]